MVEQLPNNTQGSPERKREQAGGGREKTGEESCVKTDWETHPLSSPTESHFFRYPRFLGPLRNPTTRIFSLGFNSPIASIAYRRTNTVLWGCWFVAALRNEPRASGMQSQHPTTKAHLAPQHTNTSAFTSNPQLH